MITSLSVTESNLDYRAYVKLALLHDNETKKPIATICNYSRLVTEKNKMQEAIIL